MAMYQLERLADLRTHHSPEIHCVAVRSYGPTVMPLRLADAAGLPVLHMGRN